MRRRAVAIIALSLLAIACSKPPQNTDEDGEGAERRRAVLGNLASNVVVPSYESFQARATELREAVDAWSTSGGAEDREAAREAWRTAMVSWEVAEVYQFGPAGPMGATAGGEDLRDAIYSWPTTNPCRVDQEIVEENFRDAEGFRSEPVNVRGLDALEYLLYREDSDNACDPSRTINADGSWAALDAAEIDSRRAAYAATLTVDLETSAVALVDAWTSGFADELAGAGTSSETYPTTHEALNAVSDGLFYVESDVKDMKIGEPAGVLNCVESICPEQREFLRAELNFEAIAANLDGFEGLLTGHEGLGFDDLLEDAGQGDLAADMLANLETARDRAESIEGTMADTLATDPEAVVQLHADVKGVTDLLKTQFVGVLDLELPARAEGDND